MQVPPHLIRRHQTWAWRRRMPNPSIAGSRHGRIVLSLKTSELGAARRIALRLDAAWEDLRQEAGMDTRAMAQVLTKVRDDALAAGEIRRAMRPADLGFSAAPNRTIQAASSEEAAAVFAEVAAVMAAQGAFAVEDAELIDDGDDPGAATAPAAVGGQAPQLRTSLAVSRDRATLLQGVAGFFGQALRRNDRLLAGDAVQRAVETFGIDVGEAHRALLERQALRVLADAHAVNAARERGDYADTPVITLPQPPTVAEAPPLPPSPPAAPAPQPAGQLKLFSEAWAEYRAARLIKRQDSEPWTAQTDRQNQKTLEMWLSFHGDRPLDQYNSDDSEEFKTALEFVPKLHGKSPEFKGPMRELVKQVKELAAMQQAHPILMSKKTIKRHMSALAGFYTWLGERKREYGYRGANIFHGHRYGKTKSPRDMWTTEDLDNLFHTPIWTGCHHYFRGRPGDLVIYDAHYWLPLIAVYHGLRQEEIAKLTARDIKKVFGIWCIDINEDNGGVKTENSVRLVPIHNKLIDLGFLNYAEVFRGKADDHLWPTLKRGGPDGKFAAYYTKAFTHYCREVEIYNEERPFHALRATFRTFLENTEAKSMHVSKVIGHSLVGALGVGAIYVKAVQVQKLREVVNMFDPEIDLGHLVPFDPKRHRISAT